MSVLTIRTNNVPRHIVYGYELTPKERKEFDYMGDDEMNDRTFFRYKGQVYDLSQYQRCSGELAGKGWDGYAGDSYFSGTLVRYTNDNDSVIVAQYFS